MESAGAGAAASSGAGADWFVPHDAEPMPVAAVEPYYCPGCGFPPEYCEFAPPHESVSQAAAAAAAAGASAGPAAGSAAGDALAAKKTDSAGAGEPAATAPAAAAPPAAAGGGGKKGAGAKAAAPPAVQVKIVSRARHKCATVIHGLDLFGVKLDKAAKAFKKQFACGCSVVKGIPGQPDSIEIQGDFSETIVDVLLKHFGAELGNAPINLKTLPTK